MTSKSAPTTKNKKHTDLDSAKEKNWQVLMFNCDCHTYQDVEEALMEAISCTLQQADQYALLAEQFGHTSIFSGPLEECKKVERPFIRIGLRAEIELA